MATVRLDPILAEFAPTRRLTSRASTLDELLSDLEHRYPSLKFRLRDEMGSIRRFVKVFVNGEEVRGDRRTSAPLGADDAVDVLHSIQGG